MVSFTSPNAYALAAHINDEITATFSEAMNPSTINVNTFTLWRGTTSIQGIVTYGGTTASFNPAADLAMNTTYTAKISTGVKDSTGVAMIAPFEWSFTTGAVDTVAPIVTATIPPIVNSTNPDDPSSSSINFPTNNVITATFSDEMDPATINTNTFILMQGTTPVAGTVTYDGIHTATFNPADNLTPNTDYIAKITTGVTDSAGIHMAADFTWDFTTGSPQVTVPQVISTIPNGGAGGVPINNPITATFSEEIDPMTITTVTFNLWQGTSRVLGTVDYDGAGTAIFTPTDDLTVGATYTAKITAGVTDLAGIHMANDISWSFTTGNADTSVPSIVSMIPADNATGVATNSIIKVIFSEVMDPTSITFTLQKGTTLIPCTVDWDVSLKTVTLTPADALTSNTLYTAMITGVTDLAGFGMANVTWSFTTAP